MIELILKYTLPTSSFINNYSLGGFVVPFDNINLYEAVFTRVDLRPPRQTALSFSGRECIPGRAKTSLSRRDITPLRTLVNFVSFKTITLIGGQFLSISIVKSKFDRGYPYDKVSDQNSTGCTLLKLHISYII